MFKTSKKQSPGKQGLCIKDYLLLLHIFYNQLLNCFRFTWRNNLNMVIACSNTGWKNNQLVTASTCIIDQFCHYQFPFYTYNFNIVITSRLIFKHQGLLFSLPQGLVQCYSPVQWQQPVCFC